MEPKHVENLHTEGTHEGILRAHTRGKTEGYEIEEGRVRENTQRLGWGTISVLFFTYPKLIPSLLPLTNMGSNHSQSPTAFNPPPTPPLPSYIPSHFLFPQPTTFTLPSEDTLPADYSVLHRKLLKQEPPPNSWWLQPPSSPRYLRTTYSVSPTISTEGWHPDY